MALMTKDETSAGDVLSRIEEDGVEFVRLWFTDILGQLKSFSVGREEMEGALEDGMGFDRDQVKRLRAASRTVGGSFSRSRFVRPVRRSSGKPELAPHLGE